MTIQTIPAPVSDQDKLDIPVKLDRNVLSDDHTRLARLGLIRQARPSVMIDAYGKEVY